MSKRDTAGDGVVAFMVLLRSLPRMLNSKPEKFASAVVSETEPRPIIIRFMTRTSRDLTWKSAKQNEFLKSRGYNFKEDLSVSDREARRRLWPVVEKARKEGKSAYFSGARAFIEGKELRPDGKGK